MGNDGGITKVIPMALTRLKRAVDAGIPFVPRVASMKELPIKGFAGNLVYLRTEAGSDHFTLVLNVGTLNFSLRDAAAQDAMHANYQALLNNLPWPVQWRFSVRRVDPAALVRPIERQMAETKDDRVRQWLADQLRHINNLVSRPEGTAAIRLGEEGGRAALPRTAQCHPGHRCRLRAALEHLPPAVGGAEPRACGRGAATRPGKPGELRHVVQHGQYVPA